MTYHYDVSGKDFSMAGCASTATKKKLQQLGVPMSIIKKTAVAMYEAEINMVVHGGGGVMDVDISDSEITIVLKDQGPGIPDLDKAMEEGYSTAPTMVRELGFGAGMGLPNMKRNSDFMNIETAPGKGTTVTMKIKIGEA